jgi:heme/copper-type cytochrome/quinol oxidase subunit 2
MNTDERKDASAIEHFTTRRGFVAALGFGAVSLYGLWVAYGAAPGPLTLLGIANGHPDGENGRGGHGAETDRPSAEEFRRLAAEFVNRYRMPDGSVYPRRLASRPTAADAGARHGDSHAVAGEHAGDDTLDVYLLAEKWFYEPAHLRLDARVPYRFRLMAADVSHGASIQFGRGSRMIRLRPNTVAEIGLTFTRPGNYLVYCTVYCGEAHDAMQARIEVV